MLVLVRCAARPVAAMVECSQEGACCSRTLGGLQAMERAAQVYEEAVVCRAGSSVS